MVSAAGLLLLTVLTTVDCFNQADTGGGGGGDGNAAAAAAAAAPPAPPEWWPTPAQLQYQTNEIVALITLNMATYAQRNGGDVSCGTSNWASDNNSPHPIRTRTLAGFGAPGSKLPLPLYADVRLYIPMTCYPNRPKLQTHLKLGQ